MFPSPLVLCFTLFVSLPLLILYSHKAHKSNSNPLFLPKHALNQPTISPPNELEDDDLALFHRATAAAAAATTTSSRNPSKHTHLGKTNPKPKIAFLFLTNSDLHFAPLWERFFHGKKTLNLYNIYIHADPTVKLNPISYANIFKDRFIHAKRTQRASPSLIAAARRLLATAILDDPSNYYFALVSQRCVPLHSFHYMYTTLFGKDPITAFRAFTHPSKYKSYIEILSDEPNLSERYAARGDNIMLPEVPFERFRVGSQFFILKKQHAMVVLKDTKLWNKFKLRCLNDVPCYPEEHYFPTLLSMEDPKGCSEYTLTRVNWTGCFDGHPLTYEPEEVNTELVLRLRKSENNSFSYFFARKFSPECLQPLMSLADDVIFRD